MKTMSLEDFRFWFRTQKFLANIIIINPHGSRRYRKLNNKSFQPANFDQLLKKGDTAINVYQWMEASPLGKNRGDFVVQIKL